MLAVDPACGLSVRVRWPESGPRGQPRANALPPEPAGYAGVSVHPVWPQQV